MFRAKETYYVRKIIEELAHLKVVNHDSTLKHEIMQNCVNHAIELTAVYAQYLDVSEDDGFSNWVPLNTPAPESTPSIPDIQSIIDNFVESNKKGEEDEEEENGSAEDDHDYKYDSAQLYLPDAATVEHDIDDVIFVRSAINDNVIYILPRHLFKLSHMDSDETPFLIIGDVCVLINLELDLNEAKKYLIRLEKTLAINALDPRAVDLKSDGDIPILTLQAYDWRIRYARAYEHDPIALRAGFEIHNNTALGSRALNDAHFNAFELQDTRYVLVPTHTPEDSSYKLTDYNFVRCLSKGACDIDSVENIEHLQDTLDEYSSDFIISDAIKIAEMSNPLETPNDCLAVGSVQRGSTLLNFDMTAIDGHLGSTFKKFRSLMKFPTFDHLDQKKDNYIDMDIGHWGLTKYFFTIPLSNIRSKMFEGCRLSCTTFESLMLSIYNISPIGEFEDFIYNFIHAESKVDDALGYKSWWFYKRSWADFQHLKDEDTLSLYVAHLLHSLGTFEFYYRECGEVYLYELKAHEETDTYALKLKLIRQVNEYE
jgi:hypothetical protein